MQREEEGKSHRGLGSEVDDEADEDESHVDHIDEIG